MKKFTLLIGMLLAFILTYGQKFKLDKVNALPYSSELMTPIPEPRESNLKAGGDVFFNETFNWKNETDPKGWTLPDGWMVVEDTDFGCPWVWRAGNEPIGGRLTNEPGHAYAITRDDGYFVLPMDEYNYRDGVNTANSVTAWFQLPPIDCSSRPGVILSFRQFFRCYYTPNCTVYVSNDEGVHWAAFSALFGTTINVFCFNPYPEINISEVAAGMPNVWIKFVWNDMSRYFWCIDDIQLWEPYQNDLKMEDSWQYMADIDDEDNDEGFVYMVPASQLADKFGSYTFAAGFQNFGMNDLEGCKLNVEVFKNGVSFYNQTSEPSDIWTLERDTFSITTPFVPDGYGDYKMVLTGQSDQAEERPSNNSYTDTYYITDSIYSICDWTWEEHSSTAAWGNNDGDYLGAVYDIKKACEVNSISCVIMVRPKDPGASTKVGYNFQYFLWKWDEAEGVWIDIISSEYTEVTEEMLNTWVTLDLLKDGESEFIEPGFYIASIQTYHGGGDGPDNKIFRFTIGADQSHQQSLGKSVYRLIEGTDWGLADEVNMVRLNINATGAPALSDVLFNVDMTLPIANGYFNPAGGDFLDVAGTFNGWGGSDHLTDSDGDGIYTLTIPAIPVFQKIEYKYRINGNWNTSEFPSGGPNRVYRTTYYNMLHDVYNNGISMGVDLNTLTSSVSVYPNPSEGAFNLEITSSRVSDLNITVTSLQGQTVYSKQVKSVLDYRETIDLTRYAKGIYLLKVNDQAMKLVVK